MNKKKLILTIVTIFLFFILILLTYLLFHKLVLKKNFEDDVLSFSKKNENPIFEINKIILFSSCDAKNKSLSYTNFTLENLYQYTDMAFFIKSISDEKNSENTLKKLVLSNIKYNSPPSCGETQLYYKNINNFSTSVISEENSIKDELNFQITSDDEADLDKPILYNNLANPIVISYVNSNIKNDYTITDTSNPITYDGSLLKKCNVPLDSLACNLSFDIYITNYLEQEYKCSVSVDIPLNLDNKSIYEGSITLKKDTNLIFYRYK